jgi:exopolysaccharide biosynthesis protein
MTDEEKTEPEYSISTNEDGTITLLVDGEESKTVTAEELNELFSKEDIKN